jgi:hypothetical protein
MRKQLLRYVYVHALPETGEPFILVEKGGGSVERLKQIADALLHNE